MNPDNDITLNIGADTEGVDAAINRLQQEIQAAFGSANTKVRNYGVQLDRITERIERQVAAMRRLAGTQIETPQWQALTRVINDVEQRALQAHNAMQQLANSGQANTVAYQNLQATYGRLAIRLQELLGVQAQMQAQGQQFMSGADTEQYARMSRELQRLGVQAGILRQRIAEAGGGIKTLRERILDMCRQGISRIRQLGHNIRQHFSRRTREARYETNMFGDDAKFSFNKALKFVIRYGLGMASLFRVYRRLRKLTVETMQALGKAVPEIGQQIVDLSNHVTQLKNSLATVAQPLFTYLLPAIHAVINALVSAMNALANFFAMLTGQKFIYKAAKGNKTLADSISGAGKAAKEAKEEIAEYDKLIVLDQPNDGSGGGGGGGAADDAVGTWEKVDGYMTHFIQDVQRIWSVFQQAWKEKGESVMNAFTKAWDAVKNLISDIWHTFVDVFTHGTGLEWVKSILDVFTSVLGIVESIATEFNNAWNKDHNGYKAIKSIFDMWTEINKLASSVGKAFSDSWSNGVGESISEHILHIWTNIHDTVTNLVAQFRKAWDENDRGVRLFDAINGIIDTILANVEDITADMAEWASSVDFGPALEELTSCLDEMRPLVDDIGRWLNIIWDWMISPGLKNFIEIYLPAILKALGFISGFGHELFGPLLDLIELLQESDNPLKELWDAWSELSLEHTDALFELQKMLGDFVWELDAKIKKWVATKLGELYEKIKHWLLYDIIRIDIYQAWYKWLWEKLTAIGNKLLDTLNLRWAWDLGKNIIEGLWKGLITEPREKVRDWCDKHIVQPIKKFFGIHSPSTLMKSIGKDIIQGLWNGIKEIFKDFFSDWTKKIESIYKTLTDLLEKGKEALSNAWNNAKQKLAPVAPYIKNQFSIAYGGVTGVWGGLGSYFSNKSESVKSAFNGLDGALGGIFSATYHAMTKPFSNTANDFDSYGQQAKLGLGFGADKTKSVNSYAGKVYSDAYKQMIDPFKNIKSDFDGYGRSAKLGLGFGGNTTGVNTYAGKVYGDAYTQMTGAFSGTAKTFEGIGASVQTGFSKGAQGAQTAMENLAKYVQGDFKSGMSAGFDVGFQEFGNTVTESFKQAIDKLKSAFNNSITTMAQKLNDVIAKLNSTLGRSSGHSKGGSFIPYINTDRITIPMAQGGVIPPNKEFLALLGDQHTGTNIETPLDTMIEAFRTALNEDGSSNHAPIVLQLNGKEVARAVWDEELKRYKQTGSWNPRLA